MATSDAQEVSHLELYRLYRSYLEHEDELIHQRQTWSLTIQGFLFATFGFSVQKLAEIQSRLVTDPACSGLTLEKCVAKFPNDIGLEALVHILPFVGFGVSLFAWLSIEAARMAIEQLRNSWKSYRSNNGGLPNLPMIVGGGSRTAKVFGFFAPRLISFVFMGAWWYLLLYRINLMVALAAAGLVVLLWVIGIAWYAIETYWGHGVADAMKAADYDNEG
jgi:hypothetical protein